MITYAAANLTVVQGQLASSLMRALYPTADAVPDPAPKAPPGTEVLAGDWIGYFKWFALVAGMFGLIICGIMMMLGRRHRSALATDGAAGIPWVIGGLMVVSLASTAVGAVLPSS